MTIPQKIINYLDKSKIKYEIVNHRKVFTAQDKAATLKLKPSAAGKTLVLKADKNLVIFLLPGNKNLDKTKAKKIVSLCNKKQNLKPVKSIDFISETVMKNKFKGVKLGAIPPFGVLYNTLLFVDRGLTKEKNIFVNSGIYEASFKVSPKVFEKLGAIRGVFSKAKK